MIRREMSAEKKFLFGECASFMGILIRLILLLYVLVVMAGLIVSAGVCLGILPPHLWQSGLKGIIAQPETLPFLAVMMLASLCLIGAVFSGGKKIEKVSNDIELNKGMPGEVKVTVNAIVSVVERAAISVSGVREVKAEVFKQNEGVPIKVRLLVTLGQGFAAPKVSESAVAAVNDAILTALQISDVPIEVKVVEVTHAISERERRVV